MELGAIPQSVVQFGKKVNHLYARYMQKGVEARLKPNAKCEIPLGGRNRHGFLLWHKQFTIKSSRQSKGATMLLCACEGVTAWQKVNLLFMNSELKFQTHTHTRLLGVAESKAWHVKKQTTKKTKPNRNRQKNKEKYYKYSQGIAKREEMVARSGRVNTLIWKLLRKRLKQGKQKLIICIGRQRMKEHFETQERTGNLISLLKNQ